MIEKLIWAATAGASTMTVAKFGAVVVPIITSTFAQVTTALSGGLF